MEIKADTTIADAIRFLKIEYSLSVNFKRERVSNIACRPIMGIIPYNKKKSDGTVFFVIDRDTVVSRLINFFYEQTGLHIELRNKDGIKLPSEGSLKEIGNIPALPSSPPSIKAYLEVALGLDKSGNYADIDWIFRIFELAAYKATSSADKWLVVETLLSMVKKNDRFSAKQSLAIIDLCVTEKEDYEKIYTILSKSECLNAITLAKEVKQLYPTTEVDTME